MQHPWSHGRSDHRPHRRKQIRLSNAGRGRRTWHWPGIHNGLDSHVRHRPPEWSFWAVLIDFFAPTSPQALDNKPVIIGV